MTVDTLEHVEHRLPYDRDVPHDHDVPDDHHHVPHDHDAPDDHHHVPHDHDAPDVHDVPDGPAPVVLRPALLAGEERDAPEPCIFRGTD
jgi:hypothetical protein